jgi:4-phytase/acid phosphatase
VCDASNAPVGHTFPNHPWVIRPVNGGRDVTLGDPLGQGSTMVQAILLEYAEGMPAAKVTWARASTAPDVLRLSEIRKVKYEFYERVPYIAHRGASNIFN